MTDEKEKKEDYGSDDYSFIKETIKKRPMSKRKVLSIIGSTALLAVLFGAVSCTVFYWVQPWAEEKFARETPETVKIDIEKPKDEEEEEDNSEQQEEENDLEISDYEKMYAELYAVSQKVNKSVVTVTQITNLADWHNEQYVSKKEASGLMIDNTNEELLILTENHIVKNAEEIIVTFSNGYSTQASVKSNDGNTGLAVISVANSDIDYNDAGEVTANIAVFGSSRSVKQGDPVIAIGSPLGYNDAVAYGFVTSVSNSVSMLDASYRVLTTDIIGTGTGSGVLVNMDGKVIGIVSHQGSVAESYDTNTLTCLGVTEVGEIIERLSNGEIIPYIGIKAIDFTKEIAERQGISKTGIYITDMELEDSPAAKALIQRGDIITHFNGEKIGTVGDYQEHLLACKPGDTVKLDVIREGSDGYVDKSFKVEVGIYK